MQKPVSIVPIFPIPVGVFKLDEGFTAEELKFIEDTRLVKNILNRASADNYILEDSRLRRIKDFCKFSTNRYVEELYKPNKRIEAYITQSWANVAEENEGHHSHTHSNSFLSGVLYVTTDEGDGISFERDNGSTFHIDSDTPNDFNTRVYNVPAEENTLLLFPSHLRHAVSLRSSKKKRISIAFNTYLRGILGNNKSLSELFL